jgi:hypothetical protein
MKITKSEIKRIIKEEYEKISELAGELPATDAPDDQETQRTKKVATGTTQGGKLGEEEYKKMLAQVLLTPNVTAQVRKKVLESIFGNKGTAINSLVLKILKGIQ